MAVTRRILDFQGGDRPSQLHPNFLLNGFPKSEKLIAFCEVISIFIGIIMGLIAVVIGAEIRWIQATQAPEIGHE